MSFDKDYGILEDILVHYILVVRRNYRPVAYHNFAHAVSVTHSVYHMIRNGFVDGFTESLEAFGMILAALNHALPWRDIT